MPDKTVQDLIQATLQELNAPEKPAQNSRVWKSTNGYIHLVAWSNASLFRVIGVKWMQWVKANSSISRFGWKYIDRLEAQFLDCLRSGVANIEEGFARPTTSEYLQFLGYSQASLKEAKGDVQRSKQDGLLQSMPGSSLASIHIDLKDWHEALKQSIISKPAGIKENFLQSPLNSFNYSPIDQLDPAGLTYEMFIEIANKTDWHQRRLVGRKSYQVNQARIREAIQKK
jgi:four helix bundle protein